MEKKNIILLLSGGVDSTACIHYYKSLKYNVQGLFIDYGHPASKNECKAIKKITDFYRINFHTIKINFIKKFNKGLIKGRNAVLILTALMNTNLQYGIISMGIHKGTGYADSTNEFVNKMNNLLELYTDGSFTIDVPFIDFYKKDIIEYCKENLVPIQYTYSCELGLKQPCGKCNSCNEMEKLYANKML